MEKTCVRCKTAKPVAMFCKLKASRDGLHYWCRQCLKEYRKQPHHYKKQLEYNKAYYKTEAGKAHRARQDKKAREKKKLANAEKRKHRVYKKKDPLKVRARWMLGCAIAKGLIAKQPCSVCGNEKAEAHHPDHLKPFDVVWLCRKHHVELHVVLRKGVHT